MEAEKIKCPSCGSTEITHNVVKGMLVCGFCRTEFKPNSTVDKSVLNTLADVASLEGMVLSEGMKSTAPINTDIQAFRCPNCNADVGVSTETNIGSLNCHWCRHQISIADKVTNGVRPDGVIEFEVPKLKAKEYIQAELKKKKFFALPAFVSSFNIEKIQPVYLPYVMVDINSKNRYKGMAGVFKRKYTTGSKNHKRTKYDYDLYQFQRLFDFQMNNLLIEANRDYFVPFGQDPVKDSKNVLNNIQPFNCMSVKPYTPVYFNGEFRVEFKDVPLDVIRTKTEAMIHDIAVVNMKRASCVNYTHGVRVESKELQEKGTNYSYVLAPVWLYTYCDSKNRVHYIAVNGQTGKASACVPVNKTKLLVISMLIELAAVAAVVAVML